MPLFKVGSPSRRRGFGGYGRSGRSSGLGGLIGGGKGRIVVAVVIALIALVSFWFGTQENPITGEKERVSLSLEQETRMGLSSAPEMVQQMGGQVPQSSEAAQFVRQTGEKLMRESGLADKMRENNVPWQFSFTLLDDPNTVNAFALPGGPVFITTALLDRLENEAQLAGILGHEIGHVVERHGAERMAKQQLGQQLAGAAAVGTGDLSAAQATQFISGFINMSYGRQDELESDTYGLNYMIEAGYDPREMVRVMEILKEASGGGGQPEFMSTHPLPESRIEDIKAFVEKKFPDGVPESLGVGREFR